MSYLNDSQSKAVEHIDGAMIVLAGPGSGKTTVIAHRVKNLIENNNVPENKILIITFSKAATVEMENKFKAITDNKYRFVGFNTFHSLFFRIIRNYYNIDVKNIISEEEKKWLIKDIMISEKMTIEDEDELQNIINEISLVKNELIDVEDYDSSSISVNSFRKIFNLYHIAKDEKGKIDFDDMLSKCNDLLSNNEKILQLWQDRYDYILVDEFQDINKVQYECLKKIAKPKFNLFIVGDDDQSVYKFRGARPEFLLNFGKEIKDVKEVILDINYRSTNQIINLSNAVIRENKIRYEKIIKGTSTEGDNPKLLQLLDIRSEAYYIADKIIQKNKNQNLEDIAVIFRTNIQARAFVDAFMDRNIPFQLKDVGSSIYEHWIAKDLIAYIKLAIDNSDNKSLRRIINKPSRFISKSIIEMLSKGENLLKKMAISNSLETWQHNRIEELVFGLKAIKKRNSYDAIVYIRRGIGYDDYIKEYAQYRKVKSKALYEILDEIQEAASSYTDLAEFLNHIEETIHLTKEKKNVNKDNKGVVLTTMHSSKGLEFTTVFVVGAVEGLVPYEKATSVDEIEEERRLFYVALTRAKKELYISVVKNRHEKDVKPSRFLSCINNKV